MLNIFAFKLKYCLEQEALGCCPLPEVTHVADGVAERNMVLAAAPSKAPRASGIDLLRGLLRVAGQQASPQQGADRGSLDGPGVQV